MTDSNGPDSSVGLVLRAIREDPSIVPPLRSALSIHASGSDSFDWSDLGVMPDFLQWCRSVGIAVPAGGGRYRLADPGSVAGAIRLYQEGARRRREESERLRAEREAPAAVDPDAPVGMFSDVVGYPEVKRSIILALNARVGIHVLLWGPPASSKSLFMEEIGKLPRSLLRYGPTVTNAGIRQLVMDQDPDFLVVDEIDKVPPGEDDVLLEIMEHRTVSVLHHGENQSRDIRTRVYAAANDIGRMRPALLSRFHQIALRAYTDTEFKRIAFQHLVNKGADPRMARMIADGVCRVTKDVRDARRIFEMAGDMDDARFLLSELGRATDV